MITVKEKHLCTGCEACSNVCPVDAIAMLEDEEGFRYPHVDERLCIQCEKCLKVCLRSST
jgi:ferredoxin